MVLPGVYMISRRKSFFFVRYFYRWTTIVVCIALGIVTLWFYSHTLAPVCNYPDWFTVTLFGVNILLLTVSTIVVQRLGKPRTRTRMHHATMFVLLILNPALAVGASRELFSILWTLSISTYLLYCLLFVRFRRIDLWIIGVPLFTVFFHLIWHAIPGNDLAPLLFKVLFGLLMSVFYGLFYWFFKFCLDNTQESLSVYLENEDINSFLEGYALTPREKEVCACIVNGYSAGKIAEKLFISPGTAKNHTKHIYKKIGISRRMELMHLIWDFTMLKDR